MPADDKKREETEEKKFTVEEVESTSSESKESKKPETAEKTSEPATDNKLSSFQLADVEKSEKPVESEEERPEVSKEGKTTEETQTEKKEPSKDWLSDVKTDGDPMQDVEKKGGKKKFILIILLVVLIGALVGGGIYYYQTQMVGKDEEAVPIENQERVVVPTTEPEEEETATDSAEVALSDLKLNILNGSGIPGEAGKVQALLEVAGFESIETGNANSYDYVNTEVSLKNNLPDTVYDEIKSALEGTYIVERADETLDEDYDYDVEIVVGSKKAETSE